MSEETEKFLSLEETIEKAERCLERNRGDKFILKEHLENIIRSHNREKKQKEINGFNLLPQIELCQQVLLYLVLDERWGMGERTFKEVKTELGKFFPPKLVEEADLKLKMKFGIERDV